MDQSQHLTPAIDARVRIGHVHLRVGNLERATAFYCGILGFGVSGRIGDGMAFLAAGDYHHHIALNCFETAGCPPPEPGSIGLHHFALLYPDRSALAAAVQRLVAAGVAIDGAFDHGGSEAIYVRDPDGNGVELSWDRPAAEWPRDAEGQLVPVETPLDLPALLAAA